MIQIPKAKREDGGQEISLEEFSSVDRKLMDERIQISDPVWLTRFHVHHRIVGELRRGNVFLAGDASHIHSPVGGQGMNTGIQDAANLGWKLALVASGRGRPELLDSYQAGRHPVGEALLRATGGFSRVVLWRNPVAEAVRNRVASILTSFDAVQDRIRMAASELGIHYRRSPIVRDDGAAGLGGVLSGWLHAGPHAGDRATDGAALRAADRTPVRLFELLAGARHMLLV